MVSSINIFQGSTPTDGDVKEGKREKENRRSDLVLYLLGVGWRLLVHNTTNA